MTHYLEEQRIGRCIARVTYDECPENPREIDPSSRFGEILYTSNRYTLGDRMTTREEIDEIVERKDVIILWVSAYIHGGVALSWSRGKVSGFSCPWDSGICGIMYATHEEIAKEYGCVDADTIEKAYAYMAGEMRLFDSYARGEVYIWEVVLAEDRDEVVESCGGYYGDDGVKEAFAEARSTAAAFEKRSMNEDKIRDARYALYRDDLLSALGTVLALVDIVGPKRARLERIRSGLLSSVGGAPFSLQDAAASEPCTMTGRLSAEERSK